jgi:hypothetical protein
MGANADAVHFASLVGFQSETLPQFNRAESYNTIVCGPCGQAASQAHGLTRKE